MLNYANKLVWSAACALVLSTTSHAQIVVVDPAALDKMALELQGQIRDYSTQLEQLRTLQQTVLNGELQLDELAKIFESLTGDSGLSLYLDQFNDLQELGKQFTSIDGALSALQSGDLSSFEALLGNPNTVGGRAALDGAKASLEAGGFSMETVAELAASSDARRQHIAAEAGGGALQASAANVAYEEASASLDRLDGLVAAIGDTETLKESTDVNSLINAEMVYVLGQMFRLNAATGLADGNSAVILAGEKQAEIDFFGN